MPFATSIDTRTVTIFPDTLPHEPFIAFGAFACTNKVSLGALGFDLLARIPPSAAMSFHKTPLVAVAFFRIARDLGVLLRHA
jgi:hypothetical protein